MSAVLDLFDAPVVAGFALRGAFLSLADEADLVAHIDAESLSPFKFQQWTSKRLTRSYGWSYDFESGNFAPTEPIPDWLQTVKTRAAQFAGLQRDDLVQALLIRYDPGAGIGWHSGLVTVLRRSPERLELATGDRRDDQAHRRV